MKRTNSMTMSLTFCNLLYKSIALLLLTTSTTYYQATATYRWTICHSQRQHNTPPSQWDNDTYQKLCFLNRNDTTSAPGSALFQHLLADYTYNSTAGSSKAEEEKKKKFDPFTDFPTWDIINEYPDIGDNNDTSLEYYTLWYTTLIDLPSSSSELEKSRGNIGREGGVKSWRGHLTLHGVNYRPIVYFNGTLLHPYTASTTTRNDNVHNKSEHNEEVGGMFTRRHYDLGNHYLTTQGGSPSSTKSIPLEILVIPPPYVGRPIKLQSPIIDSKYGLEMNQGGDHNIAKSGAIMQFTAGWDWIQSTKDRNVGIYDKVHVEWISGDVMLHDLHVRVINVTALEGSNNEEETKLPLGDDVTVSAWLDLSLIVTNHRHQTNEQSQKIEGKFEYWITSSASTSTILTNGSIHNVTIESSSAATDYHLGEVYLPKANLWWPHTHSNRIYQPLYTLHLKFTSNGVESNTSRQHECQTQTNFGIRTLSSYIHPQTKSFTLKINGHPIFLTGGNWITSDQYLRYSNSPKRYYQELSLIKHLGMNSIRIWGGGVAETNAFYNAADKLGLVVYQEFWMTGDNNGRMAGSYDWPVDHEEYLSNVEDTIRRLRNHPSLCLYAAGNELFPLPPPSTATSSTGVNGESSSTSPPADIERTIRRYIDFLDNGRLYVTSSVTEVSMSFDNTRTLGPKDGPYEIHPEEVFFDRNGGYTSPLLTDDEIKQNIEPKDVEDKDAPYRNIGFQTEVGSVSHPELKSLRRFLSQEALDSYPNCGESSVFGGSVHEEWTYFKYMSFTANSTGVDHICQFYFPPHEHNNASNTTSTMAHRMDSIEDYTWAAQLAQYLQYKSLFEGYTYRIWEWYSAVFLWKVSSPAPTFRGALYDSYLSTNGGYWGAYSALAGGQAVRVVLNFRDWTVHIINAFPVSISAVSVRWNAYSFSGVLLKSDEIPVPGDSIIYGDTVAHLDSSLPWVGENMSSMTSRQVQDVVIYRLDVSYVDDQGTVGTAKNSYYMTDPSAGHSQSRFALLGALRKEMPLVNIDASCTVESGIACTIQNGADVVAVMVGLTLVHGGVAELTDTTNERSEYDRILPTLFSDNYLTLLPQEKANVHVSLENIDPSMLGIYLRCSEHDGYVQIIDHHNKVALMVSIDGWNVQEQRVHIFCGSWNLRTQAPLTTEDMFSSEM